MSFPAATRETASDADADQELQLQLPLAAYLETATAPAPTSAPEFQLTHPTPHECTTIWNAISPEWRDALTPSQFLSESAYLLTVPLARDGGMTMWILVHKDQPNQPDSIPAQREILASCETFMKVALLSNGKGDVEEVIVHGIASVFCDPKHRGKGYPKMMLKKLAKVLETWQVGEGERCVGSMLWSDIGKKYYSSSGWKPALSNFHIEIPAADHSISISEGQMKYLQAHDLAQLCQKDENIIRLKMAKSSQRRMMILPNHDHILWHHSKEEFVTQTLMGRIPEQKGVLVGQPGNRVWAIWTHRFYSDPEPKPSGNVLYILRLVVEDPEAVDGEELWEKFKKVFQAARVEASKWNLDVVKVWDPSPGVQMLMRRMCIEYTIVDRDEDGIGSLMWYGDDRPEWIGNEKYAWC